MEENVDAAQPFGCGLNRTNDLTFIGDVNLPKSSCRPDLVSDFFARRAVEIESGDPCAVSPSCELSASDSAGRSREIIRLPFSWVICALAFPDY